MNYRLAPQVFFAQNGNDQETKLVGVSSSAFEQYEVSNDLAATLISEDPAISASDLTAKHGLADEVSAELSEALSGLADAGILISSDAIRESSEVSEDQRGSSWLPRAIQGPYHDVLTTRPDVAHLFETIQRFTFTTPAMLLALDSAIRYIVDNEVPGDIVECGVWRGGTLQAAALLTQQLDHSRHIWGYDTFSETWESPSANDALTSAPEVDLSQLTEFASESIDPLVSEEAVTRLLLATGVPEPQIHLVKGLVQETLAQEKPQQISLLRLDTDLYDSTRVELQELYDLVAPGGVIILDDYAKFTGPTKALHEFLNERRLFPLLNRLDEQGCMFIKEQ